MKTKGFIIAGMQSGVGKTTIAIGLMAVLKKKGMAVQPFKAGPDYIDPSFHRLVCEKPSYNLDTWMMGVEGVKRTFAKAMANTEVEKMRSLEDEKKILISQPLNLSTSASIIGVVEGVMGLFDGKDNEKDFGSTAHIAKILKLPVILVIDAGKMAQSAGAVVYGFERFDKDVNIAGVIFNRVGSDRHFKMIKSAVEERCKAKVLGYIPKNEEISLPERHLGLAMMKDSRPKTQDSRLKKITELIERFVDVDEILKLVSTYTHHASRTRITAFNTHHASRITVVKIAVAYDNAFCFYYQENLDILKKLGAGLKFFSPLKDKKLPDDINGIYIGGGYPELYAKRLSENKSLMAQIKNLAENGMPIYAECGGLMYLGKGLKDLKDKKYDMAGIFPWTSRMLEKRKAIGYREVVAKDGCLFLEQGQKVRGHEFHYSEIDEPSQKIKRVYQTEVFRMSDVNRLEHRTIACIDKTPP